MRISFKNRLTIFLFCLPFAVGCQRNTNQKNNITSYLPPTYIEETDFFEFPVTKNEEPKTDGIWDVSEVDISYVNPNRKLISFTFDDAPSKTLENILAVFAHFNEENPDCIATATVFANGKLIDENALSILHTAVVLGFELGNHTQSHLDLTTLSQENLQEEIHATDELLSRIDGKKRHLLRAPFGRLNDSVKKTAEAPIIDWTIDTLDWTGKSEEDIFNTVENEKFSGAIVLMHDGYPNTVDALKRLLPDLKAAGYQVVSISALAKAHNCTLKKGGEYVRLRKQ